MGEELHLIRQVNKRGEVTIPKWAFQELGADEEAERVYLEYRDGSVHIHLPEGSPSDSATVLLDNEQSQSQLSEIYTKEAVGEVSREKLGRLSRTAGHAYRFLRYQGPLARKELKLKLNCHRTTLDQAFQQLREVELLCEETHPEDGRKKIYWTPNTSASVDDDQ